MATEKEHTPMEKLVRIRMQFVTLLNAKLPEPYRADCVNCIQWCNELEEHLTMIDESDDHENN